MKKAIIFLGIALGLFISIPALVNATMSTDQSPIACTMEYAPVCGEKVVQCIKAPCNPVQNTYSNRCMMNADNATFVHQGECGISNTIPTFCSISNLKLQRGSRGDFVTELQQVLARFGFHTDSIDGVYGKMTLASVKNFQRSVGGLTVDGIFGNYSRMKLCNQITPQN